MIVRLYPLPQAKNISVNTYTIPRAFGEVLVYTLLNLRRNRANGIGTIYAVEDVNIKLWQILM